MSTTIKEARQALGLTQKQMANIMGQTQQSIARIETGKRTETNSMLRHLTAIEVIAEHGLIEELASKVNDKGNRTPGSFGGPS